MSKYERKIIILGYEQMSNNKLYYEFSYLLGGSPEFIRFNLVLNNVPTDGIYKNSEVSINRHEEGYLYSDELIKEIKDKCKYIELNYENI